MKCTYKVCDEDLNRFALLFQKVVYPYKIYVQFGGKVPKTYFQNIEHLYSDLNLKNNSNLNYKHAIKVFNTCNMKHLCDNYSFSVKIDILFLANEF